MAKSFHAPVSVAKDTNKVIFRSDTNLSGLKTGDQLRLQGDNLAYTIGKIEKIFVIKDFTTNNGKTLKINADIGINFLDGDIINILYEEYELLTVFSILNGGSGYKIDSIIKIDGGSPVQESESGLYQNASLIVKNVDENGAITEIGLDNKGKYLEVPANKCGVLSDYGKEAVLECEFTELESKKNLERTIFHIKRENKESELVLETLLPRGIKKGKLSLQKYIVTLTGNYLGETKTNVEAEIVSDFTPNLRLPLIVPHCFSYEFSHNQALYILDKEIHELRARVKELESKIWNLQIGA